jgi:hypothetical protein
MDELTYQGIPLTKMYQAYMNHQRDLERRRNNEAKRERDRVKCLEAYHRKREALMADPSYTPRPRGRPRKVKTQAEENPQAD